MRATRLVLFGACALALSLAAASTPAAQQPNDRKKPPKQTPDKGIDDPEPAGAPLQIGERRAEGATIVNRADGSVVALLDESFHDALVATRNADGTVSYTCLHGLPAGAKHIAENKPPVSKAPALEEK